MAVSKMLMLLLESSIPSIGIGSELFGKGSDMTAISGFVVGTGSSGAFSMSISLEKKSCGKVKSYDAWLELSRFFDGF